MINRLLKNKRGASAVELALIAPIFVAILMAMCEFGFIMFTYNTSQNAARDVARRLATNRLTTSNASADAISQLPPWVRSAAKVDISQTNSSDYAKNMFIVDIYYPAVAATPTNYLMSAYKSAVMHSKVTSQQEASP